MIELLPLAGLKARLLLLAAGLAGFAVAGLVGSRMAPGGGAAAIHGAVEFIRGAGGGGPALFAILVVAAVLSAAVPASLLGIAAGVVYGLVPGFLLAAGGILAGAAIAFGLSRSVFRPSIERLVARGGRLQAIDAAMARQGWKFVALMRLSPVMPFGPTSYLLGLSRVSLPGYLGGTLAALLPLFGYVVGGTLGDASLSRWAAGGGSLRWLPFAVGAVATLALAALLGRIVLRRAGPGE